MNVTSPTLVSDDSVNSQLNRAQSQMRLKNFSEAIAELTPIVKGADLKQPRPEEVYALLMMADAQRFNGCPSDAYQNYVIASQIDASQTDRLQRHILSCLGEIRQPIESPIFEQHLIAYFHDSRFDNTAVDQICSRLLITKFQLDNEEAEIELSEIVNNHFLTEAVANLVLADPGVEVFLHQLRAQVFTTAIENGLVEALQPIVLALALHAERVEYAFPISESERVVLLGLRTLLETDIGQSSDIQGQLGSLLLYSMYEPIHELNFYRQISVTDLSSWPELAQPFIKKIFSNRSVEQALAESIQCLNTVTQDVSKAVMSQYETNPYPRWEHIFTTEKKVSYLDLYPAVKAVTQKVKKFNKPLKCLVAGSGTGKQPLWLLANCRDISITALDLSLPSLCFAKRQATELNLQDRIEFYQGDILDLDLLERKFDIIECSGVLHHMEDPDAGLTALLKRLRSNGILRLGLYSQIARSTTGVNEAKVTKPDASIEDIRALRQQYLLNDSQLPSLHRDFFTASECRDLLFHVQEHQFDLSQIKQLLAKHGLRFLGFNQLDKETISAFRQQYNDILNLDQWHQFEQENPYIFKGMYQFHCQK